MKFSVVIPVFDTERFLTRCLDSFAAQTEGDFEAIVVDDASPGDCRNIVAKYDGRFKYVRHERNLGLFQARQTGLRAAQGDYIVPFDSDDYAKPELLSRLRGEFADHPETDVIVYQMMYDDGRRVAKASVRYGDRRLSGRAALEALFASKIQCGICGKAVRREVYRKAMDALGVSRDFYLNSSEDLCQTFPVLANARYVSTLSYPGYCYRLNGDSLTTTLTDPVRLGKAAENTRRVFDTLADFVRSNGHDLKLLTQLEDFRRSTLRWYLGCIRRLPEAEWCACVTALGRHFDPALVAREAVMLQREEPAYRLGRLLVAPLKKILGRA